MSVAFNELTLTADTQTADLIAVTADSSQLIAQTFPEVALIGASSSLATLNFDGALRAALSSELSNVSYGAAGVFNSFKDYLRDDLFAKHRPQLLIWQFPLLGGENTTDTDIRDVLAAVPGPCPDNGGVQSAATIGRLTLPVTGRSTASRLMITVDDVSIHELHVSTGDLSLHLMNSARMVHQGTFYTLFAAPPTAPVTLEWTPTETGMVKAQLYE